MRAKGYRFALEWIVLNDDTEFLRDAEPIANVTTCLVADLFGAHQEQVIIDLISTAKRLLPASFASVVKGSATDGQ